MHPLGATQEDRHPAFGGEGIRHLDDEPPADAFAPQSFHGLAAGHVCLTICQRVGSHRTDDVSSRPGQDPGCAWSRAQSKSRPVLRACQGRADPLLFRRQVLCFWQDSARWKRLPQAAAADAPAQGRRRCVSLPVSNRWAADTRLHPAPRPHSRRKPESPPAPRGWRDPPATRCCRRHPAPASARRKSGPAGSYRRGRTPAAWSPRDRACPGRRSKNAASGGAF